MLVGMRMLAVMVTVRKLCQQLDTLYLQRQKLRGVGRQSVPALSINDNCPTGRPASGRFQVWDSGSRAMMSLNFNWTCR